MMDDKKKHNYQEGPINTTMTRIRARQTNVLQHSVRDDSSSTRDSLHEYTVFGLDTRIRYDLCRGSSTLVLPFPSRSPSLSRWPDWVTVITTSWTVPSGEAADAMTMVYSELQYTKKLFPPFSSVSK
jgi:hypothetical protein